MGIAKNLKNDPQNIFSTKTCVAKLRKMLPPLDQSGMSQVIRELRVQQEEFRVQNEELRRVQQELETSRARYFDLYNLAPVGYCNLNKLGLILEANLTVAALLGVARGVLINQSIIHFILPQDQDIFSRHCHQIFESCLPQSCELRLQRPDASTFWVRLAGNLAHEADGSSFCRLMISDITDWKEMEDALRRSEEKYRTVADFAHDWEFWLGEDRELLYCSPSCQRITGLSLTAFQKDPSLLREIIHPDDLAVYDRHRQEAEEQKITQECEFRIIRNDGSRDWRWIAHVCQPIYDDLGRFLGTRGSNRDVTERKRLENEVMKARNLESLGVLAGGIAHDFNNLFQGLFGNISLAKMYTEESSKAYQFLQSASQVFGLAIKLTGQLIAFSTGGMSARVNIQPTSHIREEVTSSLVGSGREVEFDLAENLWQINVDPLQFRQVIRQMVLNAIEAMSSVADARLKVKAENEPLPKTPRGASILASGSNVVISIQDQGCGISENDLSRIFEPYFSNKPRGAQKGMGLGLALCDAIIRKHGGSIAVESKPDIGTTFYIHLPAVESVVQKTEVTKDMETIGPRILLMDDDQGVVQVTTEVLSLSGYRVDSAPDGDAAIAAYLEARADGNPYAVVILDLTVPGGLGGKDVVAKLKEIDAGVKAIVSSGYTSDDVMTHFANYGFVASCPKPYLFSEMKALIEQFV